MINLIPPEGHQAIQREYVYRVGGTFCFLFGSIALILAVALIPTYILIGAQMNSFSLEIEKQNDKVGTANKFDEEIKVVNTVLTQLKTATGTIAVSSAIDEIQKIATERIVFKTFMVGEPGARGVITIQAQGIAPTREILAKFKANIIASDSFETAEVPIADLARDVDLPFAITITFVPEK